MAAPADGYTLLFIGPNLAYTPVLYPSLNFDPLKSLAPVATVAAGRMSWWWRRRCRPGPSGSWSRT